MGSTRRISTSAGPSKPGVCLVNINFHHRVIFSTLVPIAVLVIIGVAYYIHHSTMWAPATGDRRRVEESVPRRGQRKLPFRCVLDNPRGLLSLALSILFQVFACDPLDGGLVYLRTDYRIECDSSSMHRLLLQVYAGFTLLLYTFVIPALYATVLSKHRGVLLDEDLRGNDPMTKCISSLWRLYKPEVFYYDLVECLRRFLLGSVVVFMYPNTVAQIAVALMITSFSMVLFETLAPYDDTGWSFAWVSRRGHAIIFCSMYLALLLKIDASSESAATQEVYEAILVAAHAAMVLLARADVIVVVSCGCRGGNRERFGEGGPRQ